MENFPAPNANFCHFLIFKLMVPVARPSQCTFLNCAELFSGSL